MEVTLDMSDRSETAPLTQPSHQRGEGGLPPSEEAASLSEGDSSVGTDTTYVVCGGSGAAGEEGTVLGSLGLTVEGAVQLTGSDRSRLLNFLLRWERFEVLHRCLDVLIPRNPTLVSLRDLRAKALLAEGRLDEALSVVQRRLERRVSLPARALLARTHLARGDGAMARKIVQALVAERDESPLAWSLLGEVELACGNEEAALSAYRLLHDRHPNSRAYLWGMGSIYAARGDLVTASGYAVQLLRLADEGGPLSVVRLRDLRDYFKASGESTRVAEIEVELTRRYADELAELREQLSSRGGLPAPSKRSTRGRHAPPLRVSSVEQLPSYDGIAVSDEERRGIMEAAQDLFGFDSLLPGQLETMVCVMRGEDVLTVLPTGGGKSLCYQLPAVRPSLASEDRLSDGAPHRGTQGTTLVISPLIALMKDQVDSLPRAVRQRATTLNSTLDGAELRRRMDRVADGVYRLVYAAPERLRQPPFVHALRCAGVERLVIDEAHCVSMWGHDFRPDYLTIGRVREDLGDPPLLAMTATAPQRVRRDIVQRLAPSPGSRSGLRIVAGDVTRPNLQLEVFRARDADDKLCRLLAYCQAETGSGIVYADTRARCEELAALLRQHGVSAIHYHAGIADRHRVQDDFMAGRSRVVVATIAFGMGIDKPDIRFIVHFTPPASLEAYYQEAGRAGRDGLDARCVLMYSPYDRNLLSRRARRDDLPAEFLREVYAAVKKGLGGKKEGRIALADLERELRTDGTRIRVAVSLLEEAMLLRRGPDMPRAAQVCLSASCRESALPDDLGAFRRAARLRPQQWLTLDLAEVAPKARIPLAEIEHRILAWQDTGWLMYRPAGRDLLLCLLPPPPDAAEQMRMLLERHEAVQAQRVDEIFAYAKGANCRHGHLNAYLGGRSIERCDVCDNCVEVPPPPDPGLPEERTQILTILRCVANAPWGWGRTTVRRILRGDLRPRPGARPLHEKARAQPEFGALGFRSKTAIDRMVGRLEDAGFLAPRQLQHGGAVIEITPRGQAALQDPATLDALTATPESQASSKTRRRPMTEDADELDVDEALLQALRAWRLVEAREREVSAFIIFHNSHLRAIAAHRPTTLEALSEVEGVGPKRLERYGSAVIDLVRVHLQNEQKSREDGHG